MNRSSNEVILRLAGLTKSYGGIEVLRALNLEVQKGEFLTILGPSGSGKTTLLRLIAGLVAPTTGQIMLAGSDLAQVPINKRPFNTVFQDYALFPHMSVQKNVSYGLMVTRVPKPEMYARVAEVIDLVELTGFEERFPNQLSGGQRQRVALARALVNRPSIVLLDEPLSALDAVLRLQMQVFLKDIQRLSGVTFIFVTHDQEEAISLSDRICVMNEGALVQVGTPKNIYYHPVSEFVASFFGDTNYISAAVLGVGVNTVSVETVFGSFCVSVKGGHKFKVDDSVKLCVRPENLTTSPTTADKSKTNPIPTIVKNSEFRGSTTIVELETKHGEKKNFRMELSSARNHEAFPKGTSLDIFVNSADCAIVPVQNRDMNHDR